MTVRAFTCLSGYAAALPLNNVDTDKIIPGVFLKTVTREGLGKALFAALRYGEEGKERADFVLNRAPWREAVILVTGENFGCGSSREHAPWALMDFGIRCIIATGFADIFYNNCFKNGILPIVLDHAAVNQLMLDAADPDAASLSVDLDSQTIARRNGECIGFAIDPERKAALVSGIDDIERSLARTREISSFEARVTEETPWIHIDAAACLAGAIQSEQPAREPRRAGVPTGSGTQLWGDRP